MKEDTAKKILSLYQKIPDYDGLYKSIQYQEEDTVTYSLIHKPTGKLLDIGCGAGALLDNLPVTPEEYFGIDISPAMISQALQKHPGFHFQQEDAECFVDGKFDTIVCLYGGYLSIEAFEEICKRNAKKHSRVYLHLVGENRNATYIEKQEHALGIPMNYASPKNIRLAKKLGYQVHLLNAFNQVKTHFPAFLYRATLKAEKHLPIPSRYFTWALLTKQWQTL